MWFQKRHSSDKLTHITTHEWLTNIKHIALMRNYKLLHMTFLPTVPLCLIIANIWETYYEKCYFPYKDKLFFDFLNVFPFSSFLFLWREPLFWDNRVFMDMYGNSISLSISLYTLAFKRIQFKRISRLKSPKF